MGGLHPLDSRNGSPSPSPLRTNRRVTEIARAGSAPLVTDTAAEARARRIAAHKAQEQVYSQASPIARIFPPTALWLQFRAELARQKGEGKTPLQQWLIFGAAVVVYIALYGLSIPSGGVVSMTSASGMMVATQP